MTTMTTWVSTIHHMGVCALFLQFFCITAVCTLALQAGQVKKIEQFRVFVW